jgi:outer membrane protein assembly factor BamB
MVIKFGWMEIMEILNLTKILTTDLNYSLAVIPTVLIPLTGLSVLLVSIASVIAGWFGIKLSTEGPKQLLEVLLKKKVLFAALIFNLAIWGGVKGYHYVKNYPSPLFYLKYISQNNSIASKDIYENSLTRNHYYIRENKNLSSSINISLSEKWHKKLEKGSFRSGVLSSNSIFYGVDDKKVYELNLNDGATKRTFYVGTQVTTRPVIFNNRLYVGEGHHETHHARIYAFDLNDGKFLNAFQTKGHTEGQPHIASYNNITRMFITAGKDGVYAIDPISMKEIWHSNNGHIDATIEVENDTIYSGTGAEKGIKRDQSFAVANDFLTGSIKWKTELPLSNWMHPLLTKEDVCYTLGEIYFPSQVGLFYCLDKKTGKAKWSIPFNAPLIGKPLLVDNDAIISTDKGEICSLDTINKKINWCQNTGTNKTKHAFSSPEYDKKRNLIWYATPDNGLFALDLTSGKILTHWLPEKAGTSLWKLTYGSVSIKEDSIFLMDLKGNARRLEIKIN